MFWVRPRVCSSFWTLKQSWHSSMILIWWQQCVTSWQPRYGRVSPSCSISAIGEYIAKRGSHPSGTWMYMQGRGVGIQPLPSITSPDEGLLGGQGIHTTNGTDQGCLGPWQWSIMGSTRGSPNQKGPEGGAPPYWGHPGGNPRDPGGSSEAVTDDREVDSRRGRGWRYGEHVPWPISPPQLTSDVSQLLTMLTAGQRMGTPHINTFSGDATPRKTKVCFEHWYHEVWCVKYHYPEAVQWESIIQSLKGEVADMARYMGTTTSVDDHILMQTVCHPWHCGLIGCTQANFYKVSQRNNEKVPFFVKKLEGTLNQIQL